MTQILPIKFQEHLQVKKQQILPQIITKDGSRAQPYFTGHIGTLYYRIDDKAYPATFNCHFFGLCLVFWLICASLCLCEVFFGHMFDVQKKWADSAPFLFDMLPKKRPFPPLICQAKYCVLYCCDLV